MMVYLSGKVTGLPRWWVIFKFTFYELMLTAKGFDVWNPIKHVPEDSTHSDAMCICLEALEKCDSIYMMPNWYNSEGAKIEFERASELSLKLINSSWKLKRIFELLKKVNNA